MRAYVIRRLLTTILVIVGVTFLTFALIRLSPGDPVALMLGTQRASEEAVQSLRDHWGLDDPFLVAYGKFLWRLVHLDLGTSFGGDRPVLEMITEQLPSTLQLTVAAMTFACLLGIPSGVIAATSRSKIVSSITMLVAMFGISVPGYWLGTVMIIVICVQLNLLPVAMGGGIKMLILPSLALGLSGAGTIARMTRSAMLEVINADFARTARAKGLRESIVIRRHVFRNALIPVVTVVGLQFGALLGGAFFIEAVFGRPGLGKLVIGAIQGRDTALVMGTVVVVATAYVLINFLMDLLYGWLDPRITYQ